MPETGQDEGNRDQARKSIAKSFSKDYGIPLYAALELYDLVERMKQYRFEMTTAEEMKVLSEGMTGGLMRWRIRRMPHEERRKIIYDSQNVLENYIESTVEGLLSKGKKIRVHAIAKQVEFYKKIPKAVVTPTVKRVVHRVRVRAKRFSDDETAKRVFKRHGILVQDFQELVRAGVIGPRTGDEALDVLGKAMYHHYNITKRLKLV